MKTLNRRRSVQLIIIVGIVCILLSMLWWPVRSYQRFLYVLSYSSLPRSFQAKVSSVVCNPHRFDRTAYEDCLVWFLRNEVEFVDEDMALRVLDSVVSYDRSLAPNCHVFAHIIGEAAYARHRLSEPLLFSPYMGACSFGFYHGFMQEIVSHEAERDRAVELCEEIHQSIPAINRFGTSDVYRQNCMHGIGHGLVFYYAQQLWGQEDVFIENAVADCRRMPTAYQRECFFGVYGGVALMYFEDHGYSLSMNLEDPFRVCSIRPEEELVPCYDSLTPALLSKLGFDVRATAAQIMRIVDDISREQAFTHLGSLLSHQKAFKTDDPFPQAAVCREFRGEFFSYCFSGFVDSLLFLGSPQDAFRRAAHFCDEPSLNEGERSLCMDAIRKRAHQLFGEDIAIPL